nr:hypothetical protein GCM10017611_50750 [Rhodococcus wratislaviensis]
MRANEDVGAGYLPDRSLSLDPPRLTDRGRPDGSGTRHRVRGRMRSPAYAAALEAAGVPVRFRISPGMLHGYRSTGVVPRANELADQPCEELAELHAPEHTDIPLP